MKKKLLIMMFTSLGLLLSGVIYAAGEAATEPQGKKLLPAIQKPTTSNPGMGRAGEVHGGTVMGKPITNGPNGNGGMVMGKPITGGPNGNGGMAPVTGGPKGGGGVMDKGDETAQKPGGHLPKRDASLGRVQRTDDEGTTDTHRGGPPKSGMRSKEGIGAARGGKLMDGPYGSPGDPIPPPTHRPADVLR